MPNSKPQNKNGGQAQGRATNGLRNGAPAGYPDISTPAIETGELSPADRAQLESESAISSDPEYSPDEFAVVRAIIAHPSFAKQVLAKVEIGDFQSRPISNIVAAARFCAQNKIAPTLDQIEEGLRIEVEKASDKNARLDLRKSQAIVAELQSKPCTPEILRQARDYIKKLEADWKAANIEPPAGRTSAFELLSFKDLQKIPRLQWLIRGILLESIASALTAKSGDFKSFIALCMALCIATGRAFFGHEVKRGNVVYVAAEGFYTMFDRATAWAQFHDCELPENFHIVKAPVNLADTRVVAAFMESIETVKPAFIVLDTLSQCAIGMNENDNADMADFVRGMMSLGNAIGAHVQVLHHNAKATGTFRGAGSFGANLDAHISLDRPQNEEGNTIFVRCEKQRGKPFEPFALRGEEVLLPYADEYSDPISALVFEPCGDVVTAKVEKHASTQRADKTRAALLEVFDRAAAEAHEKGFDGVKVGFWKEAVEDANPPICSTATFWTYRKKLVFDGEVIECGTHNGSPIFKRKTSTPSTPSTLNQTTWSEGTSDSKYSNNPLGVGVLRVPGVSGLELPAMPKADSPAPPCEPYTPIDEKDVFDDEEETP
jgi:hypothetical protein